MFILSGPSELLVFACEMACVVSSVVISMCVVCNFLVRLSVILFVLLVLCIMLVVNCVLNLFAICVFVLAIAFPKVIVLLIGVGVNLLESCFIVFHSKCVFCLWSQICSILFIHCCVLCLFMACVICVFSSVSVGLCGVFLRRRSLLIISLIISPEELCFCFWLDLSECIICRPEVLCL